MAGGVAALVLGRFRDGDSERSPRILPGARTPPESAGVAPSSDESATAEASGPEAAAEPDRGEDGLREEAGLLAAHIRVREARETRERKLFEAGLISQEQLTLASLDLALDRAAARLLDPEVASPISEIEAASFSLKRRYTTLFEAGALSAAAHREGVGAAKALRLSLRWFESSMGRVAAPVPVEEPAGAGAVEEVERQYLEAAVRRLAHGQSEGDRAARIQRLLAEARLGRLEYQEARTRALAILSEADPPLPVARQDDLRALLALFDWYRFAGARRSHGG